MNSFFIICFSSCVNHPKEVIIKFQKTNELLNQNNLILLLLQYFPVYCFLVFICFNTIMGEMFALSYFHIEDWKNVSTVQPFGHSYSTQNLLKFVYLP